MNASKYLHSQKGKVIEKMKIAYLSGKHIMVIEKLDDILLREIILDSSIIPYRLVVAQSGASSDCDVDSIKFCANDAFINNQLSSLPNGSTMYVYKAKESMQSTSPQIAKNSPFPDASLSKYLEHLSELSSLCINGKYPRQYKALLDSIIVIVTNSPIDIPSKYAPYTEYICVPFIEIDEFMEVASEIISSLDNISIVRKYTDYSLIDKPDAECFLNDLYQNMKGMGKTQIKAILNKAKVVKGCVYTNNVDIKRALLSFVREEANSIIAMSSSLSIIDATEAEEPAGLDNMSGWITNHKTFIKESSLYAFLEMSSPKGILVSGVPGTGKSMMAKYVAKILELPLVRFDLGDLLGGFVGDSERNMRESLTTIDALAPCVVWIDEMEKAFSTSNNTHEVTKRLIGKFLTWMQEKKTCSFVFATANDISSMPPEMFRSGRFDEKFYTFMPSARDCGIIFEKTIKRQIDKHRKKTVNNFEAKPLFPADVNANMFYGLLNDEGLCIIDRQTFDDDNITRRNKFFIGSDIAKVIEDAKSLYVRKEGIVDYFDAVKFRMYLRDAIRAFKSYGETNLDDIAKCYSKLANLNFESACDMNSVILPFEGYDELRCASGGDLYLYNEKNRCPYDSQMFVSVRNALNKMGKSQKKN